MELTILLPLLVAIVGALVFALSANPKLSRMGEISFFCGLLVTLFQVSTKVLRL